MDSAIHRLKRNFPSIHLIIGTRWAPVQEFEKYVSYPDFDVFVLSQYDEELRAERDGRRIAKRIAQLRGQIRYIDCQNPRRPEIGEKKSEEIVYVVPGYQRFLEVQPKYFYNSKDLSITFNVEYNSADICWSRASPEEQVS